MLPLRRAWIQQRLRGCPKRELSLAYKLHEPEESGPGHASLIVLHGLFGSKQNNRSISKYGFSCPAFSRLLLSNRVEYLHEILRRLFMPSSVFTMISNEKHVAHRPPGFKESWRVTPRSGARLSFHGERRGALYPTT